MDSEFPKGAEIYDPYTGRPLIFLFFLLGKENSIEFPTVGKKSNEFPN